MASTNWLLLFNFRLTVSSVPLSFNDTCTLPPEFNAAKPLASNTTFAATVLPVVVVLNNVVLLGAPLAIDTFGLSVTGVYSVAVAVLDAEVAPAASETLEVIVKLVPLPGAASEKVIVLVAGL